MKTKLKLVLLCFVLCNFSLFAQQKKQGNEPKVTITKKITEPDGTSVTETIVKKGQAARDFNIDAYIKDNRGDNTDLDIRSEGGDEERHVTILGKEGPKSMRAKSIEGEVVREVERTVDWVSDQLHTISESTSNYSAKAFLGVEEDSDEKEDEEGLVVEVVRNSAADLAGIRTNDLIISLNDIKVNQWSDLTKFMQTAQKGDVVKVTYRRNGIETTTNVTLTSRADVKPVDCAQEKPRGFLGISNSNDDEDNTKGVKISVVKKSAADKAGLKDGDIILQLNDTPINDFEDIEDFMEYIHPDDKIKVNYQRDGKINTIEVSAGKEHSWDWGQVDWKENDINIRTKEACLGIYNGSVPAGDRKGANIVNFTTNSSAKKAGLEVGDVILSVSGKRVQNSDELWEALSSFKPNEKIDVEYARAGNDLIVEVTLGACNDASSMVKISNADADGNSSERQFFSWNMDKTDAETLRNRQTITIHKGDQGDTPVIEATSGNESNPVRTERSLKPDYFNTSPDPSNGQLKVEFTAAAVPTVVTIYDLSGHQMFQEELNIFAGQYVQQFDLAEFSKTGIILRIKQGDKFFSEQILIN